MSHTAIRLAAACLALAACSATACESYAVHTLPFEPTTDTSLTVRELVSLTDGAAMFGAVYTVSTYKVEACTITVGYASPVIYIAKEVMQSPCAAAFVIGHEAEHVNRYRQALQAMPAAIAAAAVSVGPVRAVEAALAAVRAAQADIDTAAQRPTNFACGGRLAAIARAH